VVSEIRSRFAGAPSENRRQPGLAAPQSNQPDAARTSACATETTNLRGGKRIQRSGIRFAAILLAALAFGGCRQDMQDQPKFIPLRPSNFFGDGRSERPLIDGTIARGHLDDDLALYTGKGPDGKPLDTFPFPVTKDVVARGQDRFNIYCSPCHGRTGYGDGMVVRRGYRHPPSYHTDQIRKLANGYIFDVITNGFGAMPDYAAQVPVRDRWAIVSYVRALQLSENATVNDVPAEDRGKLGGAK
jgi:mono/diheme cytochrome c family protein